jgi:isopentenyl-diphosphate delta-isomerase
MSAELIVLVDDNGRPIGSAEKLSAHNADTPLHLAFSCYVFNNKDELLVTRRAESKKVWPGVWTNSVCGHPAPDENMVDAIKRRLQYELGMAAQGFKLILPDYRYKTPSFNGIIENEICPVYFARTNGQPNPNPEEVADFKWLAWPEYVKQLEADQTDEFSWWSKDQLKQLKDQLK